MPRSKSGYAPGKNPASLANLQPGGVSHYGEKKKHRKITVTDTGWEKTRSMLKEKGLTVSKLIELLARGEAEVTINSTQTKLSSD